MMKSLEIKMGDAASPVRRLLRSLALTDSVRRSLAACASGVLVLATGCASIGGNGGWVGTWATAPTGPASVSAVPTFAPLLAFENQTIRMIVRSSIPGTTVRIRLSNEIGDAPLPIQVGAASVALRDKGSAVVPSSSRSLTFSGSASVTIPAKGFVVSDPVQLDVPALADLAVSVYVPGRSVLQTMHAVTRQTNYVSAGNTVNSAQWAAETPSPFWYLLTGVDVQNNRKSSAIVAFGDSITDGTIAGNPGLRVDGPAPWASWPSQLAARLQGSTGEVSRLAVLNAGIAGNRVVNDTALALPTSAASERGLAIFGPSALSRFKRDALDQAGVSCVVVFEGINDIGQGPARNQIVSAAQVIAGYEKLIAQAKAAKVRVIGSTLTPFAGYAAPYYSEENAAKRDNVNAWIRSSGKFDAIIDFDAVVRDPAAPTRLLAAYDSGDHLHPSDAGYKVMADSVDLALLERLCVR